MAEFEIKIGPIKSAVSQEKKIAGKLARASRSVEECQKELSTSVSNRYGDIKRTLNSLSGCLASASNAASSLAAALSDIYGTYSNAESSVYAHGISHHKVADVKDLKSDVLGLASSIVGEVGVAGKIGSMVIKGINGELTKDKLVFGGMKILKSAANAVINAVNPNGPGWAKALIGEKASKGTGSSGMKPASKVVKWAGHALTLAENTYSNFKEFEDYGGLSNARFWGETCVETAYDIGMAAFVSTAIGTLGAPVWTAAIIAGGITFGIDKLAEAVTGKNLKETVSDGVMDLIGKAGNLISGVGNAVSAKWNKITTPWMPVHEAAFAGGNGGGRAW